MFASKVQEFESFYLSGERFEADIKLFDGVIKLVEFKSFAKSSWESFGGTSSLNQLKGYIKSEEVFGYIANKTKLLNDGVTDPLKFVKEQFQRVFKKDGYRIYNEIISENPNAFKRFGINSKEDFIEDIANLDSDIYKLIAIE